MAGSAELTNRRTETRVTIFVREEYLVSALQRIECEVYVVSSKVRHLAGANYDYVVWTRDEGHILRVRTHHKLEDPANLVPNLMRACIERGNLCRSKSHAATVLVRLYEDRAARCVGVARYAATQGTPQYARARIIAHCTVRCGRRR